MKREKHAKLFYPSARHQTAYLRVPCPVTPEHRRGYFVENTGLTRREAGEPGDWTAKAEKVRAEAERAYLNALDPKVAVPQVIPNKRTVRDFANDVETAAALTCSPAWAKRVKGYFRIVCSRTGLGQMRPAEVSEAVIQAYQRARLEEDKVSAKILREEVTLLIQCLKRAKAAQAIGALPVYKHVSRKAAHTPKHRRRQDGRRVYLKAPKLDAFLVALRAEWPDLADFVEAFSLCGLRPAALGAVAAEQVYQGALHVTAEQMKEEEEHQVPLVAGFEEVVKRRPKTGLLFGDEKGRSLLAAEDKRGLTNRALAAWKRACTKAKVGDFKPYDLRGIFQTRAAHGGATDLQVKAAMAHKSGETDTYMLQTLAGHAMLAAAKQAATERREAESGAEVIAFPAR